MRMLGAVVAVLVLAVACGDDGAESGGGSSSTTTTTTIADEPRTPTTRATPTTTTVSEVTDDVDEPATGPELVALDLTIAADEEPRLDTEDILIDGGSVATVALDDEPWWIGLDGDVVTVSPVATIAPELEARTAGGFNTLAACGSTLVLSVVDPDALVAIDVATGSVLWQTTVDDSPQIACGDADVLVAQSSFVVRGLAVADGSELWSAPLEPDDPLRVSSDQALIGTYDGVVGIDLSDGSEQWSMGGSSDAVAVASSAGVVLNLFDDEGFGYAVVTPQGSVAYRLDEDDLARPSTMFVAGSGDALAVVDPETGVAVDDSGARSLLSDDVAEVLGPGPGGLIWAVCADFGSACLIDAQGVVVSTADVGAGGFSRIALPGMLVLLDVGQAVVPAGTS